jgi:SAM-dependent methyltransferase
MGEYYPMAYIFDFKAAKHYDGWYENPGNRFVADLENQLVMRLLAPVRGERILDIGCGTGRYLQAFSQMGLDVTGLDASPYMLDMAREKLGHRAELHQGFAEDLPFEDNSFDVATLITALEFLENPQEALREACRVAEDRIFVGVLNRYAIKGIERRIKGIFSKSLFNRARFYSLWELKACIQDAVGKTPLRWGTVLQLPASLRQYTGRFEKWPLVHRCPFGCFIGVVATLVPRFQTRNITVPYVQKPEGAAPGVMKTP